MNIEMFLENYKLDITKEISALVTFAIDDVKDFSARSTSWSKTIVLPGTANNNKQFGHIFQVGQSNTYDSTLSNVGYNFNASKSANVIIFQNSFQNFKGVLRLLQININQGQIEYEVSVFGELAGLNVALSGGLLEDLDFSEYDEVYNAANVVASWDNTPGSGIFYPLIDYGTYSEDKHDWDIRTFRPALYVKEYIDKMFEGAGYRYSSSIFETARFKGLIIPHSQKALQQLSEPYFNSVWYNHQDLLFGKDNLTDDFIFGNLNNTVEANGFSYTASEATYTPLSPATFSIHFDVSGTKHRLNGTNQTTFYFDIYKNASIIATQSFTYSILGDYPFHLTFNISGVQLAQNDIIHIVARKTSGSNTYLLSVSHTLSITSDNEVITDIMVGDDLVVNGSIPKNIRQIDFLLSIVKLFNLYVYEDKIDEKLIYLEPYVDFYPTESSGCVDWSYKLNRNKAIQVKPMSEIIAKIYEFKYKSDSDYYNDLYKKRYGQDYGNFIYNTEFEFNEQKKSFELIFSPTPLVGFDGEEKVYSSIMKVSNGDSVDRMEETADSNIRILQTKKITGVEIWDIKDGVTILTSLTKYGYAGHLDDPDAPSNDLNFGATKELFFTLESGGLSATQFNLYWSSYMSEITDKDSKLFIGHFYLTPKDIFDLDFSRFIMVDGVLFRLNKIIDYNMSNPSDCKVELLKVQYLIY